MEKAEERRGVLTLQVPWELRNQFKAVCTFEGTTMRQRIIDFMRQEVTRFDKARGKR